MAPDRGVGSDEGSKKDSVRAGSRAGVWEVASVGSTETDERRKDGGRKARGGTPHRGPVLFGYLNLEDAGRLALGGIETIPDCVHGNTARLLCYREHRDVNAETCAVEYVIPCVSSPIQMMEQLRPLTWGTCLPKGRSPP